MQVASQQHKQDLPLIDDEIELWVDHAPDSISKLTFKLFSAYAEEIDQKKQQLDQQMSILIEKNKRLKNNWIYHYIPEGNFNLACSSAIGAALSLGLSTVEAAFLPKDIERPNSLSRADFITLLVARALSTMTLSILVGKCGTFIFGSSQALPEEVESDEVQLKKLKHKFKFLELAIHEINMLSHKAERIEKYRQTWEAFTSNPQEEHIPLLLKRIGEIPNVDCELLFEENHLPLCFSDVRFFLLEEISRILKDGSFSKEWQSIKEEPKAQEGFQINYWKQKGIDLPSPRYYYSFFKALSSYSNINLLNKIEVQFKHAVSKMESRLESYREASPEYDQLKAFNE